MSDDDDARLANPARERRVQHQVDALRLDAAFLSKAAALDPDRWPQFLEDLLEHAVSRFELLATHAATDPDVHEADYRLILDAGVEKVEAWLSECLPLSADWREEVLSRISLELLARRAARLSDAKARAIGSLPMPASDPAAIRTIVDYVRDRNAPSQPKAIPSLPNAKAPAPSASGEYVFRHSSHGWEVKYGGQQSIQLPELKGLTLIQTLLRHPGKAISVVDLLQMGAASIVSDARVDSDSMRTTAWEGEPVLDKQAQKDVKAELDRLVAEAELARESGNEERLSELTEEIIAIREHDNRTRGLGGRQRALGSEVEQFRKTARAQYRTALKCLRASLPALAQHLTDNVRSGRRFVYRPPSPLPWET